MKVHNEFQQNSLEWLVARAGIPTASEFDNLVTPEWKIRTGATPRSYIARKLAEAWLGGPLPGHMTIDMDIGRILESEAIPYYELTTNQQVQRVGFITTDDGKVGCSPDGMLDGCGLEIKCPAAHTHVGYLLNGTLPKEYAAQVHGGMFVTGFDRWVFMSYCRRFPPLILTVKRDEGIQETLLEATGLFLADFECAWGELVERNGGLPKRRKPELSGITCSELEDIAP